MARPAGAPLLVPPVAELPAGPLVLGMAGVDHSGRVRDRLVLAARWGGDPVTAPT